MHTILPIRVSGGPNRLGSATRGSVAAATASLARSRPSPARKAPSMSAVNGRRSYQPSPSPITGISAPGAPARANRMGPLSMWEPTSTDADEDPWRGRRPQPFEDPDELTL